MCSNPTAVFDFVISCVNEIDPDPAPQAVRTVLNDFAKKWAFQLERGDSGNLHWQGRMSLKKKRREGEIAPLLQASGIMFRLSVTSKENISNVHYVTKTDTYIAPHRYTDTDEEIYIPRQIREIESLRPWQQCIVDQYDTWDTRHINLIYDPCGNIGKSTLVGYMRAHRLAVKLPYCNDYKDIMRMVMDIPTSRCYLIDMPRAICKDRLHQFYAAIEEVKSGYAYDDRYHFKDKVFDCPNIWVFSNTLPQTDLLSNDRWRIWQVANQNLVPFVPVG